jgi:hypothetical protein
MTTKHRPPCVDGDVCGERAHCPPSDDRTTITTETDRAAVIAQALGEHWNWMTPGGVPTCMCGAVLADAQWQHGQAVYPALHRHQALVIAPLTAETYPATCDHERVAREIARTTELDQETARTLVDGLAALAASPAPVTAERVEAEMRVRLLDLAEWHETKAEKARRFPGEGNEAVMAKAAQVHDDAARRLRDVVGVTVTGGEVCGWCGGPQHDPGDCAVAQCAEAQRLCDEDRHHTEGGEGA